MRPGVIAVHGHTLGSPPLHRKQQAVIFLNSSCIRHRRVSDPGAVAWRLKTEQAARIRVTERGARVIAHTVDGTRAAGNVHGRIEGLIAPQMNHVASQIARGDEPVLPDLPLNAEIPRISRRCPLVITRIRREV